MLTKRIIFTLLYDRGFFMHSRNFSLQKAGNAEWIVKNYNFEKISRHIDEIIFLDVSRDNFDKKNTFNDFKKVTKNCFVPKSIGGKLRKIEDFEECFENGADKIVINTSLLINPKLIIDASKVFGSQSIIGSIDVKKINNEYIVFTKNGSFNTKVNLKGYLELEHIKYLGEIYLNSIDKDGTGQGYDTNILKTAETIVSCPIILAGGAGQSNHFSNALASSNVDALATANLFNFIGSGLETVRNSLTSSNFLFPNWDPSYLNDIKNNYLNN